MSRIIEPPTAVRHPSSSAGMTPSPLTKAFEAPVAAHVPSTTASATTRKRLAGRELKGSHHAISAPAQAV